ncbi:MAG: hypothetical protein QM715_19150 [Nibricoccus sp.]
MKNLARFILVSFAAQLLFVGIANAKVTNSVSEPKAVVFAMPDGGDEGPWEGLLTPDGGDEGPWEGL